jgi:CPA1 family monovalent cation:H+ antiporter
MFSRVSTSAVLSKRFHEALFLTLSGAKGTVSLSIAFSLPVVLANGKMFTHRPLILFVTVGVIILTLITAFIAIPLLNGNEEPYDADIELQIAVVKEVINVLRSQNYDELGPLIVSYQRRRRSLEHMTYSRKQQKELHKMRKLSFSIEAHELTKLLNEGKIDKHTYHNYHMFLSMTYHLDVYGISHQFKAFIENTSAILRMRHHPIENEEEATKRQYVMLKIYQKNSGLVINAVKGMSDKFSSETLQLFIDKRLNIARQVSDSIQKGEDDKEQLLLDNSVLHGYYIERKVINDMLEKGKMTATEANNLLINVNQLESFTLIHNKNSVAKKLREFARR